MKYAPLTLELQSSIHAGSGRRGMLAHTHRFIPGHILNYALAAAIGKHRGGTSQDFSFGLQQALKLRCGHMFLLDASGCALSPLIDQQVIEAQYITASNHVALHLDTASAVDGALFEVESISARVTSGKGRGRRVRLAGGIWYEDDELAGKPIKDWFGECLLGGELTVGHGRVKVDDTSVNSDKYAGRWAVSDRGLEMASGTAIPGASIDGGINSPLIPWVGRLFDEAKGFGRKASKAALVRMDAPSTQDNCFLPNANSPGLGCWTHINEQA